jgi:long-chain acyl-CoA synthetase
METSYALPRIWTKHYDKKVPHTYQYPDFALWQLAESAAKDFPDNTICEFLGKSTTYRTLWNDVLCFAQALQSLGVKKGDRVAIMLPNCPQYIVAFYGALRAGAIVVGINPLYTARELELVLHDSGAETLIILDMKYRSFDEIASTTAIKNLMVTGLQDAMSFPKSWLFPLKMKKDKLWVHVPYSNTVKRFTDVVKSGTPHPTPVPSDSRNDIALLLYTGGTTGVPKAAMLTHYNLVANCVQNALWLGLDEKTRGNQVVGSVLPFFHSYGLSTELNLGIYGGSKLVLMPRFDVKMSIEAIQKHRITIFPGVPAMYIAINNFKDTPKYDLSSVRYCTSGAAPLPIEVAQEFSRITKGAKLVEGYGLSEASPVTHCNPLNGEIRVGSIGVPVPDTDVKIVDDHGDQVPQGEVGEICVSGPQVMLGYWNRPDETAKCLIKDDTGKIWLHTGDMARMDEDGYFYIVDRIKDMIIVGGFNVYPREVEEVLFQHPKVKDAVAIGVPHSKMGETVKVFVVPQDASLTEQDITAFCKERLASYKVPHAIEFRDELPKTQVGKVLRRVLREQEQGKVYSH